MSAKVNGTAWNSTGVAHRAPGHLTITGSTPPSIRFDLDADIVGDYGLAGEATATISYNGVLYSTEIGGEGGMVRITSLTNEELTGTFDFTAYAYIGQDSLLSKVTVTNGTFTMH